MDVTKVEQAIITKVELVHDYYQVDSTKFILNIYNPFNVKCNKIISTNYEILLGKMIKTVELTEKEALVLELEDDISIYISLADNDYLGPEAVQFTFNIGEVVVI